jgi:signal transduction histidine kinase
MRGLQKRPQLKRRTSLTLLLSVVTFCFLLAAILVAILTVYVLVWAGVIGGIEEEIKVSHAVLIMGLVSLVLGYVIAFFGSRVPLRPINNLINSMNRLADGDFHTRLKFGRSISNLSAFDELSKSFNTLAEELENTELLRTDFINNFSHEVKTPIVSIAGLAKLLKKGNLTDEQRLQYLNAIEEESMRLSHMATSVLNLTKVENQTILTGVTSFNLSEQIRSSILLFEETWTEKNLDLQLDFEEYTVEANEELLRHVWINLIDNAVKFAGRCGTVGVTVHEEHDRLVVAVSNTDSEIAPDKLERIFNKFYQGDESHATEGNGIGLAIVRRVVELHGGEVCAESANGLTSFTVQLPKRQG